MQPNPADFLPRRSRRRAFPRHVRPRLAAGLEPERAVFETLSLEDACHRDSPSSVTLGRILPGGGDAAPLFAARDA